jgi:transketolase
VKVVDMASVKPLDASMIIDSAKNCGVCVVVEDHNLMGGLFSAVSEIFAENGLGNLKKIGLDDRFGESGSGEDLYRKYGLDDLGIVGKIREFLR